MNKRTLRLTFGISALLFLGVPAIGHIWFVTQGVHFKEPAPDFGVPPPRYGSYYDDVDVGDNVASRTGTTYFANWAQTDGWSRNDEDSDKTEHRREALLKNGLALESRGKFKEAQEVWREAFHHGLTDPGNLSERLILLRVLAKAPNLRGGRELLAALPVENKPKPLPKVETVDLPLKPFVLYAQAFRSSPTVAARTFLALAATYPSSPIVESALISAPRVLLPKENPYPNTEQLGLADTAVRRLLKRFPHSRFRFDALGARGRMLFLARKYGPAMRVYRRQLAMAKNDRQNGSALDSIMLCAKGLHRPADLLIADLLRFSRISTVEPRWQAVNRLSNGLSSLSKSNALEFGHQVRTDPELLRGYVDYRVDFSEPSKDLITLDRTAAFRHAPLAAKGHILSQLAAAALPLNNNGRAIALAGRAYELAQMPDDKARAVYVQATVLNRTGKPLQALRRYEKLVTDYPKSYLVGGAQENLALLYERRNRLAEALDIYRKLDYQQDIAYMLDMRMSTDQLAEYVQARPHDKEHDLLVLSLGFRYLRDHRWAKAETTFNRLPKGKRLKLLNSKDFAGQVDGPLADPAKTTRELARLDSAAKAASTDESKAAGLLQLAQYYYNHRDLLLYNSALWEGRRQYVIQFSWNENVAREEDKKALDKHHWQHECFAQTLLLCRQILAQYPHTKVAARAAYTGAVSAQHLSNFGGYWRWVDSHRDLALESVHLMQLAEKSSNPWLAARAKKYAGVFAMGVHERNTDQYRTKPTKSYLGDR